MESSQAFQWRVVKPFLKNQENCIEKSVYVCIALMFKLKCYCLMLKGKKKKKKIWWHGHFIFSLLFLCEIPSLILMIPAADSCEWILYRESDYESLGHYAHIFE